MDVCRSEENSLAFCIFFAVSALGILEIFASADIIKSYTPLRIIDIIVYVVLLALAYGIHRGMRAAIWMYAVIAIIWYVAVIFFLPAVYGHTLNMVLLLLQLVMSLLAFYIIYSTHRSQ